QRPVLGPGRPASQRERRLSRGRTQPQAGVLVGLAEHAGPRIAGHDRSQSGHRRHHADADARAVLRSEGVRRPQGRLGARARQPREGAGMTTLSKPSLVLKRRLKAPPETVYRAWTHPEQMMLWWGNPNHPSKKPIAETDLRVGGRFRVQFWSQ